MKYSQIASALNNTLLPNILGGAVILGIISAVFYFRTGSLFYAEITAYYQKMPLQYMRHEM